jgi:hypothetical protein
MDGEGCVLINPTYSLVITIGQKKSNILYLIQMLFGGTVSLRKDYNSVLALSGRDAYIMLRSIDPFLVVKKEESALALEFYEKFYIHHPVSEGLRKSQKAEMELYRTKLQELKT